MTFPWDPPGYYGTEAGGDEVIRFGYPREVNLPYSRPMEQELSRRLSRPIAQSLRNQWQWGMIAPITRNM